ncbi:MAG: ATP-binding cassette domain-containing protein [Planctomycetota bacterium]|jgi:iron complex transport system ATP-binding protein|nr:ATP-binding cassette domain-containing protein [Planctomycetota bacterium]
MPAIDLKNITVSFNGGGGLRHLSWRVERGERWFILGANGAGKTTLVKVILGMLWARAGGEVAVLGCRYGTDNLLAARRKIAWASPFMPEWISGGNDALTVLQVVLTGADATFDLYRSPAAAEVARAETALAMLNAAALRDKLFAKCSSGEQVKTLIARAMMIEPELMILDETCVHLDLSSREILLRSVDALAQRLPATTLILVTHRLEEITPTFTRGLLLRDGQIAAQGERERILTPENLRAAFGLNLRLVAGAGGRLWPVVL